MHEQDVLIGFGTARSILKIGQQRGVGGGRRAIAFAHRPVLIHIRDFVQVQIKRLAFAQFRHAVVLVNRQHQLATAGADTVEQQMRHRIGRKSSARSSW